MLLVELLSRLQNSNTSLLFWKIFTGLKFLNELNIKSSLSQNSQHYSAFASVWPHIYSASSRSKHMLFTLCHSDQTIIITQSHSPLLPTCFTSFLHHLGFPIQIIHPLSSTIIWTCRSNLLHTAITFHHLFTVSLWAQNLPSQKTLSSTL